MAQNPSTQLYSTRTRPKHFIQAEVSELQQTCEYDLKWSNNILQHEQGPTCKVTVLAQFGNVKYGFHLISLYPQNFLEKIYDTPGKKYRDPD